MKHYICVEEHEITYVCGTYRQPGRSGAKGKLVIQDARSVSGEESLQDLFAGMARTHHLAGKKMTLVLGRDLSFMKAALPKSGDSALRRMARNELVAEGKCGPDCLGAVDIQRAFGEKQIPVMIYYLEKEKLAPYTAAMEQAGILHGGTLLMPDCVAAASRMLYKNRYMLMVDVEREGLGLYAVSGGHCLAWRSSPLKASRFYERNAGELLYEEIAEQAEQIQKQVESGCAAPMEGRVVLVGNCLPDAKGAAAFLNKRLGLPCIHKVFDVSMEPDPKMPKDDAGLSVDSEAVSPGVLAAIAAGSRQDGKKLKLKSFKSGEGGGWCKGVCGGISRVGAIFLLANLLVAAGISGYIEIAGYQAYRELLDMRETVDTPEYKERYQSIQRLGSEIAGETARRSEEMKAMKTVSGILREEDFQAFTDALEPGMEVEAVTYDGGESPYLEMTVFQKSSWQVPLYVERVKASGVFEDVRHRLWEKMDNVGGQENRGSGGNREGQENRESGMNREGQENRESGGNRGKSGVRASVRGMLEKGGRDEIQ